MHKNNKNVGLVKKIHFEESTIESIDQSMFDYLEDLNLFAETNTGWRKVPVLWGSAERSYQVKNDKDVRDTQGMLKLPIMTVSRTSLSKTKVSKGIFQGHVPEDPDEQGGALTVEREVYQEKTRIFASADALRLRGQINYPRPNQKVIYRTISVPMPVNIEVDYEITIRTEYQQQMNDLMLPFITKPGRINSILLKNGIHVYEGFIQEAFTANNNINDFTNDERKFETKVTIKVIAYLIGEGKNREKPHYSVRENAVEVKIPRERLTLSEIPEHEFGRYYGLAGIPVSFATSEIRGPFLFNNVPAVGAGTGEISGDVVTKGNFATVLADTFAIRELLKKKLAPVGETDGEGNAIFTLANGPKLNTEALYVNGMIQAVGEGLDYTISGKNIVLSFDLTVNDSVYVTYIIG